jgi:hypothetical protein
MSFKACIHHEGYVFFHEVQAIDYDLLQKVAGSHVVSKLHGLLQSKLPIQDPELLRRCKNTVKLRNVNQVQADTTGFVASGIPLGLSEVAYKKLFPRLEEKNLLPIRDMMEKAVIDCGLIPTTFAVVEQYQCDDDTIGIPDLVPECQVWVVYIKMQHPGIDFSKLIAVEKLRREEKKLRVKAARAQTNMVGNTGVTGVAKSFKASVNATVFLAMAAQVEKKRCLLEADLEDERFGQLLLNDTVDSNHDETSVEDDAVFVLGNSTTSEHTTQADVVTEIPLFAPNPAVLTSPSKPVSLPVETMKPLDTTVTPTVYSAPPIMGVPLAEPHGTPFSSGANAFVSTSSPFERNQRKEALAEYKAKFKCFTTKVNSLVAALKNEHRATAQQRFAQSQVSGFICHDARTR